jgi:uroporphyrinogen-III synthase
MCGNNMAKAKKTSKAVTTEPKRIEKILISQPRPESEKSPYFEVARKYNVQIDFFPFIKLEGLNAKDFRKQKIDLAEYTGVVLLSRNAVDHFFRMCDEMKFKVSQDLRYFCITEAVALYLQKFILYRKRKVFFSADGSAEGLMDVIQKYKDKVKILLPVSENTKNEMSPLLTKGGFDYQEAVLYRTVGTEIKPIVDNGYDLILMFSPFGVETLASNYPDFNSETTILGGFGVNTCAAIENVGFKCTIPAPAPGAPSMVAALSQYLDKTNK